MHWFLDPIQNHYADFNGRATRQQYWMFVLFYFLIFIAASIVLGIVAGMIRMPGIAMLINLASLALLVPSVAIAARRLHDTGKSGWWQLVGLVPFVGFIILIVLLAMKGQAGPNQYGEDPSGDVAPAADGAAAAPTMDTPAEAAPAAPAEEAPGQWNNQQ